MKNLLVFIILLSFVSCKNPLKVSIDKKLSKEIIDNLQEKGDTTISDFYLQVRFISDTIVPKLRKDYNLSRITYKELKQYQEEYNKEVKSLIKDPIEKESWIKKFGSAINQFSIDSVKYSSYISHNDWKNYVYIDLVSIQRTSSWLDSNKPEAKLIIRSKNKEGIRKISGYMFILKKPKTLKSFDLNPIGSAYFSYTGPLKSNIIETTYSSYLPIESNGDDVVRLSEFVDIPTNLIQKDHNIEFTVDKLILENNVVDPSYEKVPFNMINYLKNKRSYEKEFYIKEVIDKSFVPFNTYIQDIVIRKLKDKYPKQAEFYGFLIEYYTNK